MIVCILLYVDTDTVIIQMLPIVAFKATASRAWQNTYSIRKELNQLGHWVNIKLGVVGRWVSTVGWVGCYRVESDQDNIKYQYQATGSWKVFKGHQSSF